jgi:hypothetical protein
MERARTCSSVSNGGISVLYSLSDPIDRSVNYSR